MSDPTVIDTPDGVGFFHLCQLRGVLKLEMRGIRSRRGSAYAYVRRRFGFRGNRARVLAQLETLIADVKAGRATYTVDDGVTRLDEHKE